MRCVYCVEIQWVLAAVPCVLHARAWCGMLQAARYVHALNQPRRNQQVSSCARRRNFDVATGTGSFIDGMSCSSIWRHFVLNSKAFGETS